ncbi:hypothetical protein C1895_08605 [Pseudomonas sp. FW305-3-2-15-E-TSA4]|nr:hypothetical protein C1895_08605 [Pseudomonas sp. FW305-3-2-15-E-TSA4]
MRGAWSPIRDRINSKSFASRLAPTVECNLMWERACSRRGPDRHHKSTARTTPSAQTRRANPQVSPPHPTTAPVSRPG